MSFFPTNVWQSMWLMRSCSDSVVKFQWKCAEVCARVRNLQSSLVAQWTEKGDECGLVPFATLPVLCLFAASVQNPHRRLKRRRKTWAGNISTLIPVRKVQVQNSRVLKRSMYTMKNCKRLKDRTLSAFVAGSNLSRKDKIELPQKMGKWKE